MLTKDDIVQLGILARISIGAAEQESLVKELDSVLAYVSEISSITTENVETSTVGDLWNVVRDDVDAYPGGTFTLSILGNAPRVEDSYLKVKQIL